MAARFALTLPPPIVRAHFAYDDEPDFPPRLEISPPQPIAIVASREFTGGVTRRFLLVRWGFVPSFAQALETLPLIANARAEGIAEKAAFANAFKRRLSRSGRPVLRRARCVDRGG